MIVMPQVLDEYSFRVTLFFALSGHRKTINWNLDAISPEQAERLTKKDVLDRYPGAVIERLARA